MAFFRLKLCVFLFKCKSHRKLWPNRLLKFCVEDFMNGRVDDTVSDVVNSELPEMLAGHVEIELVE